MAEDHQRLRLLAVMSQGIPGVCVQRVPEFVDLTT